MRVTRHAAIAAIVVAVVVSAIIWGFIAKRQEVAVERERERPIAGPSRVVVEQGMSLVVLDPATQARSGIVVEVLPPAKEQPRQVAYGTVLDIQGLSSLRSSYVAAKAQVEKADAELDAARREFERLGRLNAAEKNVSDRALDAAAATFHGAEAAAWAAAVGLAAARTSARQSWGQALADRIASGDGLDKLFDFHEVLVQAALPPVLSPGSAPRTASVQGPDGSLLPAKLLGPVPRTDPRIQNQSVLYVVSPKGTGLVSGMNVPILLPVGAEAAGVVVPSSAVVSTQGSSWVYEEGKQPGHFLRIAVSLENPVDGGWFITSGPAPGVRVVTTGAQLLLSEEFRAQIQVGEEGGR